MVRVDRRARSQELPDSDSLARSFIGIVDIVTKQGPKVHKFPDDHMRRSFRRKERRTQFDGMTVRLRDGTWIDYAQDPRGKALPFIDMRPTVHSPYLVRIQVSGRRDKLTLKKTLMEKGEDHPTRAAPLVDIETPEATILLTSLVDPAMNKGFWRDLYASMVELNPLE